MYTTQLCNGLPEELNWVTVLAVVQMIDTDLPLASVAIE